jgi:hypothetical protein
MVARADRRACARVVQSVMHACFGRTEVRGAVWEGNRNVWELSPLSPARRLNTLGRTFVVRFRVPELACGCERSHHKKTRHRRHATNDKLLAIVNSLQGVCATLAPVPTLTSLAHGWAAKY